MTRTIVSPSFPPFIIWKPWNDGTAIYFLLILWICSKWALVSLRYSLLCHVRSSHAREHYVCMQRIVYLQKPVYSMKHLSFSIKNDNRNVWSGSSSTDRTWRFRSRELRTHFSPLGKPLSDRSIHLKSNSTRATTLPTLPYPSLTAVSANGRSSDRLRLLFRGHREFSFARYDESGDAQVRRRSPALVQNNGMESVGDVSFATGAASSSFLAQSHQQQQQKYRSGTQMTDRSSPTRRHRHHSHHQQPKLVRAQSRNHSSSSDERIQPSAASPMSSNHTSDDDDDPNSILSHHSRLRRKYVKSSQPAATAPMPAPPPAPPSLSRQQSLRDQPPPPSPTLRYASNGVLLRPKHHHHHQQHSTSIFQSPSKEMGKKLKRFSLDTPENRTHSYQTVSNHPLLPESNIYRSALAVVPSLNADVYGVQVNNHTAMHNGSSSSFSKQPSTFQYLREESHQESQPRPKVPFAFEWSFFEMHSGLLSFRQEIWFVAERSIVIHQPLHLSKQPRFFNGHLRDKRQSR